MEETKDLLNEEEVEAIAGGAARRHTYLCDYTARVSDRLSVIAQNFDTTVDILRMYNDLPNTDIFYKSQVIHIYR